MKCKLIGLLISLLFILFLPFRICAENGIERGSWSGSDNVGSISRHSLLGKTPKLLLLKSSEKNVLGFSFRVMPYVGRILKPQGLKISLGKSKDNLAEMLKKIRLIMDLNHNGKFEEDEDELVGGDGVVVKVEPEGVGKEGTEEREWQIVFPFHFDISEDTDFILILDLHNLEYNSKINFSILGKNFNLSEDKSLSSSESVIHKYGNFNAPVLSWTNEKGKSSRGFHEQGVDPGRVSSGDRIDIRVKVKDADGHEIKKAEIWFDFDGDNEYEEKIPLGRADRSTFEIGVIYSLHEKIVFFEGKQKAAYRFYFTDGDKEATGPPAKRNFFEVKPWILFEFGISPKKIISGETVEMSGFVSRKEGVRADLAGQLSKVDFSPFVLKNFHLGEQKYHPHYLDFFRHEVRFFLSLPKEADFGKHVIKSFELSYKFKKGRKPNVFERTEKIQSESIVVEKVPLLVKTWFSSKKAVFGDEIVVKSKLEFLEGLVFSPVETLKKFTFLPFETKETRIGKKNNRGNVVEIEAEYILFVNQPAVESPQGLGVELSKNLVHYWLNNEDALDEKKKRTLIVPSEEITVFSILEKVDFENRYEGLFTGKHSKKADVEAMMDGLSKKPMFYFFSVSLVCFATVIILIFFAIKNRSKKQEEKIDIALIPPEFEKARSYLKLAFERKTNTEQLYKYFITYVASVLKIPVLEASSGAVFGKVKESSNSNKDKILLILNMFDKYFGSGMLDKKELERKIFSLIY